MFAPAYLARAFDLASRPVARRGTRLAALARGEAFLAVGRAALARGEIARFRVEVRRVQDVLTEAVETLDTAAGEGGIAVNLARLTDFLLRHLDAAGAERSLRHVDEVLLAYGRVAAGYRDLARRRARA